MNNKERVAEALLSLNVRLENTKNDLAYAVANGIGFEIKRLTKKEVELIASIERFKKFYAIFLV